MDIFTAKKTLFLFVLLLVSMGSHTEPEPAEKEIYVNGWYLWDPYQYVEIKADVERLIGLDIQLVKEISKLAEKEVKYEKVSWKQHQLDLKQGTRDFAAGATYTKKRSEFVHFSIPYRYEENSLFVRRGNEDLLKFENIDQFLKDIENKSFKLGVIDGFIYADPKINRWLASPDNKKLVSYSEDDYENIDKLLKGEIDGFLADRLVGATAVWRAKHGGEINEVVLDLKTPIHLMFSKKTVAKKTVEKFNQAIRTLKETRHYDKIISWYLHPVLLLQTIDALWFRIIEFLGTIAFAISGLLIAYRERATLFGAFLFALIPSMGGGIIRDVIFDRSPVTIILYPVYLYSIIFTVLLGFIFVRLNERYNWLVAFNRASGSWAKHLLVMSDALALSAFAISGIVVSVMIKVDPLWLWGPIFALITGAGGCILRDILSRSEKITTLDGEVLPEVIIFWSFLLSLFLTSQSSSVETQYIQWAVIITIAGIFVSRFIAYYFKLPSIYFRKPLEDHRDRDSSTG